jgi:hypothetical protein
MGVSVAEAANRMGKSPQQVRKMAASKMLSAQRISGVWVIDERSVARASSQERFRGRPLAPARAWGALDILAGGEALWLPSAARSQVRAVLRSPNLRNPARWAALLSAASDRYEMSCHPAAVEHLLNDPHIVEVGPGVASTYGIDLLAGNQPPTVMIAEKDWPHIAESFKLKEARSLDHISVTVRVPRWREAMTHLKQRPDVLRLAVAVSLLQSDDPRARRAGQDTLAEARRRFCNTS